MECLICNYVCGNKQGLSRQLKKQHNCSLSEYQINYNYSGKHPTCNCGCGEKVNWYSGNGGFRKFVKNHSQLRFKKPKRKRITEEERRAKISKTLKAKYESGERKPWQYTHDNPGPIIRKQSLKRQGTIKRKINNNEYRKGTFFNTKPEIKFEEILKTRNIKYVRQYKIKGVTILMISLFHL